MPAKKSSRKSKTASSDTTIDAGGGSYGWTDGAMAQSFVGASRPDIRGAYGPGKYDFPDPIKRPVEKIRVVQLPGKVVYVPVPTKPPKKKKGLRAAGGDAAGIQ